MKTKTLMMLIALAVSIVLVAPGQAAELLTDGGFELGSTAWTYSSFSRMTGGGHNGNCYAEGTGYSSYIEQTFAPTPLANVATVTFWVKGPNISTTYIHFYNNSGSDVSYGFTGPTSSWACWKLTVTSPDPINRRWVCT